MNTKTRAATESIAFLVVVGIILVVLNLVAANFSLGRFDITRTHAFSLSSSSENLAARLTDRMEITAYFSENEQLGEQYLALERSVRDMLEEYRAASGGKIVLRIVHPETDEEREAATRAGVTLVQQRVFRNDSISVVEGYRGLTISYLGQNKAIPVIADSAGLEYQITSIMREVVSQATNTKTKIGVLSGHEGPAVTNLKGMLPTYEFVDVNAAQPIPRDLRALLIVEPQTPLTETELRNINTYVLQGHSLGVFGGGMKLSLGESGPTVSPIDSGINRLLRPWGVELRSDVVLDARSYRRPDQQQQRIIQDIAVPIVVFDEQAMQHPALYQTPQMFMPYTSSIARKTQPHGVRVRMYGKSSDRSIRVTGDSINLSSPETSQQANVEGRGPFGLLAVIEGRVPSAFAAGGQSTPEGEAPPSGPQAAAQDVRIVVLGTSFNLRDEFIPGAEQRDNPQVASVVGPSLNIVDWLTNDRELIAIRVKSVSDPALDVPQDVELAERDIRAAADAGDQAGVDAANVSGRAAIEAWRAKKAWYKYLNWFGIPALLAIFGILRWRMRLAKKAALAA